MLLTVNKLNEVLSGVIGNEKYSVPFTTDLQTRLTAFETEFDEAKTVEEAKEIIEHAKLAITEAGKAKDLQTYGDFLRFDQASQKFFLHSNGVTSSIPIPKVLAEKIVEAMDKELPYLPFVKAWMWFLKNPKFTISKANYFAKYITTTHVDQERYKELIEEGYSHEKATELSTFNDVSITKNGLLSTYKYALIKYKKFNTETGETVDRYDVSYDEETGEAAIKLPENAEDYYLIPPIMQETGEAYFCGADLGHRIKVGAIHRLPEGATINYQDGTFGGGGLHLGGLKYIDGYGGQGRLLLNCFVNPMHICGSTDGGDGAIRVNEYFVHSSQFAPNRSLYHESTYLEHTNEQWNNIRAEAIKASEEKIKQIQKLQSEIAAL